MNIYYKTLLKKTDSELENILLNKEKYLPDAIYAAESILNNRKNGIEAPQEVLSVKKSPRESEKALSLEKKSFLTDNPNAPQLYTRSTIMIFSVFFGVIFGTALMVYNLKQTHNKRGIIFVLTFGILYFILLSIIADILNSAFFVVLILNSFGGAILTGIFWSKYIGKEFKHRRKSWIYAALISLAITSCLLLLMLWAN
ncbi:hypothetical protein [Flagellimonas oceanensis]|uniref:hypothetical protein n=1 Tax=Flagellimonas oceanensis TaxID=2499163 RepID=UPI003BA87238